MDSTFDEYGFTSVHRDFGSNAPNAVDLCHPTELDLFGTEFEFHLQCSLIVSYDDERQVVFFTSHNPQSEVCTYYYPRQTA